MLVVFAVRLLAVRLEWRTRAASDISDRVWAVWARSEDGAP